MKGRQAGGCWRESCETSISAKESSEERRKLKGGGTRPNTSASAGSKGGARPPAASPRPRPRLHRTLL